MSGQISLAHFCEIHGPTSILCTQLVNTSCLVCSRPPSSGGTSRDHSPPQTAVTVLAEEHKTSQHRSNSEPAARAPSFSRRPHDPALSSQKAALLRQHIQTHREAHHRKTSNASITSTAVETPPLSPRLTGPSGNSYFGSLDREGQSRFKNIATSSTASDTCANCSLSLPQNVSKLIPSGAPGSPRGDGKGKNGSPVLRTRDITFTCPSSSNSSESDTEDRSRQRSRPLSRSSHHSNSISTTQVTAHPLLALPSRSHPRTYTSSTVSTTSSSPHTHGFTYLSTRHPPSPTLYSLLRRSCIRTLSCEQLPHTTSGPLYFSDRTAGSTLAFVFRLPDPRALGRGRKRSYALILLGREEKRMMAVMAGVLRVFENIANWIVELAEKAGAADTEIEGDGVASASVGWDERGGKGFLERGGRGIEVKARGLADLCGREDVFVELHRQFVCLLKELGRGLGREAWDNEDEEHDEGGFSTEEKDPLRSHGTRAEILGGGLGEGLRREVVA